MHTLYIATACFVNDQQQLLVVRKRNTVAWMLPGGKLDAHETAHEALVREVREELQVCIAETELHPLGTFESVAANEVHTKVHAQAFVVDGVRDFVPKISAEIEAMQWLSLGQPMSEHVAPLLRDCIVPCLLQRLAAQAA